MYTGCVGVSWHTGNIQIQAQGCQVLLLRVSVLNFSNNREATYAARSFARRCGKDKSNAPVYRGARLRNIFARCRLYNPILPCSFTRNRGHAGTQYVTIIDSILFIRVGAIIPVTRRNEYNERPTYLLNSRKIEKYNASRRKEQWITGERHCRKNPWCKVYVRRTEVTYC